VNQSNRRVSKPLRIDDAAVESPSAQAPSTAPRRAGRAWSVARVVVGTALVVGASSAVAWVTRKHVVSSERFGVRTVDVIGTHRRTPEDVRRAAGLELGANIFAVNLDAARASLLADPWIGDATLVRRLPDTIVVQVTEREPGAIVALGETYVATRAGNVFKKLEPGDPLDLPVVTGLSPDLATQDRDGTAKTIRRAIDLAADYDQSALAGRSPLEEVHVGSDGSLTLVVGKSGLELALGQPPYRKKLEEAARVVSDLDKRQVKAEILMLDNEARPDRAVARIR
jgi:cell division protein FtsQ